MVFNKNIYIFAKEKNKIKNTLYSRQIVFYIFLTAYQIRKCGWRIDGMVDMGDSKVLGYQHIKSNQGWGRTIGNDSIVRCKFIERFMVT